VDPDTVVFKVPMKFNKYQIKNYLEQIYKVKVTRVNTLIMKGKSKQSAKDGSPTKPKDFKKAYVTITEPYSYPSIGRGSHNL
jgi:large subunit ribosomal protein L23